LRTYTSLQSYKLDHPAVSVDISDRGLIGVGMGRTVQVLRNAFTQARDVTYLTHSVRTPNAALASGAGAAAATKSLLSSVKIHNVAFRPLEDVLCAGTLHVHTRCRSVYAMYLCCGFFAIPSTYCL
jgi:hypothetical protein